MGGLQAAVEDADPYTSANVLMSDFSAWGPTDDGRVKPDVVANGVGVYSSIATSDTAYASGGYAFSYWE